MEVDTNNISDTHAMVLQTAADGRTNKIVDNNTRDIFQMVNFVFLCTVISLFGLVTNILNIVVFFKQGFDNSMNISFFGLAISDLCCLLTLLWFNVCMNPYFAKADLPIIPSEVQYLTAGWPHSLFGRITSWVTAYITAERCLCISMPLKVKRIITPRTAAIALCLIFALNIISLVPEYATAYLDWRYDSERNRTLLGLKFHGDRENMNRLAFLSHSVLGFVAFVAVIILTTVLVVNLKRKTRWRESVTHDKQSSTINARDMRTIKMTVLISVFLITCYTPTVTVSMVTFFKPSINITGSNYNLFVVLWSFCFIGEALNSSMNIFFYFTMSSKYRQTFTEVFSCSNNNMKATIQVNQRWGM